MTGLGSRATVPTTGSPPASGTIGRSWRRGRPPLREVHRRALSPFLHRSALEEVCGPSSGYGQEPRLAVNVPPTAAPFPIVTWLPAFIVMPEPLLTVRFGPEVDDAVGFAASGESLSVVSADHLFPRAARVEAQ